MIMCLPFAPEQKCNLEKIAAIYTRVFLTTWRLAPLNEDRAMFFAGVFFPCQPRERWPSRAWEKKSRRYARSTNTAALPRSLHTRRSGQQSAKVAFHLSRFAVKPGGASIWLSRRRTQDPPSEVFGKIRQACDSAKRLQPAVPRCWRGPRLSVAPTSSRVGRFRMGRCGRLKLCGAKNPLEQPAQPGWRAKPKEILLTASPMLPLAIRGTTKSSRHCSALLWI